MPILLKLVFYLVLGIFLFVFLVQLSLSLIELFQMVFLDLALIIFLWLLACNHPNRENYQYKLNN